MQQKIRYTLKAEDRLKSRKQISVLFAHGKQFTLFPFKIIWHFTPDRVGLQCGFAVSSRNFKKAVDRNYIKRRMREAYRLQKPELVAACLEKKQGLHLFFMYIGKEKPTYSLCAEKMNQALQRLKKITDEMD